MKPYNNLQACTVEKESTGTCMRRKWRRHPLQWPHFHRLHPSPCTNSQSYQGSTIFSAQTANHTLFSAQTANHIKAPPLSLHKQPITSRLHPSLWSKQPIILRFHPSLSTNSQSYINVPPISLHKQPIISRLHALLCTVSQSYHSNNLRKAMIHFQTCS